ncbi:hypothetical protein FS837_010822, partial [Tulasnella sp. UAMH 9824]
TTPINRGEIEAQLEKLDKALEALEQKQAVEGYKPENRTSTETPAIRKLRDEHDKLEAQRARLQALLDAVGH